MRIVIQCASRKFHDAGCLQTKRGKPVMFVAQPEKAPPGAEHIYARPDDSYSAGQTWRDRLTTYNETGKNPLGLLPAHRLYLHPAYEALVSRFGQRQIFILSAGWGLLAADFLTPNYNITFSNAGSEHAKRKKGERYKDFNMLPDDGEHVVYVGGKDYLSLFVTLTRHYTAGKTVFYNSKTQPDLPPGYATEPYETTKRTNWHYDCAMDLIAGRLLVDSKPREKA